MILEPLLTITTKVKANKHTSNNNSEGEIMNIKQLQEQRAKLSATAKGLLDNAATEKRGLSATEQESFNKIKAELRSTHEQIGNLEFMDSDAVAAKIKGATHERSAEPMKIEKRSGNAYVSGEKVDFRSLAVGSFDVGTVDFLELTKKFDDYSAIVSMVSPGRVLRTSHGRDMTVPVIAKGTGESRTEGQAGTSDGTNSFSESKISATRYSSKVIPVSIEMLEDAEFDLTPLIGDLGFSRCATAFDAGKTSAITGGATAVALLDASSGLTAQDLINAAYSGVSRYVRRNLKVSMSSAMRYDLLTELDSQLRPVHNDWIATARELLAPENVVLNDELGAGTALVGNFDEALYVRVKTPATVQIIDVSANKNYEVHMRADVIVRNADAIAYVS